MLRQNKIKQVKTGLAISVFILIATALLVWTTYWKNRQTSAWVGNTAQVILKLQGIYATFNEAEFRQAVFFNTGDHHEWIKSESNRRELQQQVNELEHMVDDFPLQQKNAQELERLIALRFAILKNHEGLTGPEDFLVRGPAVENVRRKAMDMMRIENMVMQDRQRMLRQSADRSSFAVVLALAMAIILILIAFVIAMREYNERASIERQLLIYQKQLQEKIERLDSSNKELEQFAYVASHDLQEPLRKIITFSGRINEKFAREMPNDMDDYLNRISGAATRMRVLIDNLLGYSRITRTNTRRSYVNLEQVISGIKEDCEVLIQNRNVKFIHHNELPFVTGESTQLTQLFQNLISNAIKFTDPAIDPVIEISGRVVTPEEAEIEIRNSSSSRYHEIQIRDNGIGFENKYRDKIFMSFYRLHGRSQYDGTGIGLSICKKIVDYHNGYITARGETGKGSVFFVYLPKDPTPPVKTSQRYEHEQAG
jgi:signal transduction histidine kinase